MYAREVGGQVLDFGVSGKLYRNVLVMFDRQTDSLWSQLLGQAIVGPLKGTRLTMLPATVMTWGAWRNEHPDGLLLRKEAPSKATYASYWNSGTVGVAGKRSRTRGYWPSSTSSACASPISPRPIPMPS